MRQRHPLSKSYRWGMLWTCTCLALGSVLLTSPPTMASRWAPSAGPTANSGSRVTSALSSTPVVTIGVAADFTNLAGGLAWPVANSVQLAVSQTNAAGGINIGGITHTLALIMADSAAGIACNQSEAKTAANSLLNAGAVAVVGHECSSQNLAVEPIYAAAGVPLISATTLGPSDTRQGYNIMFRNTANDNATPVLLATYFRLWLGLARSAIIEKSAGSGPASAYESTFSALGGTITSRRVVTDAGSMASALSAIQTESADSIAVLFHNQVDAALAGEFSQMAYNMGVTKPIIGWCSFTAADFALTNYGAAAGTAAAEGDVAAMQFRRPGDMPGWTAYHSAYLAANFPNASTWPNWTGAYGYDAAQIIIDAIKRAGSTNPANIRDAIAATRNYQGVVGKYVGFDLYGDVIPQWSWLEQYRNAQWVSVNLWQLFVPFIRR